ncbi:cytochrome P450 [Fulvimonas yonginensis]|uniref:Cytochrome P450 n=1 Tax=Fulvimonas yonginensis TaxID=1495200 RepID=A0ABU8JA73_9GAMM
MAHSGSAFPHVPGFDSTAALLVDGYDFVGQRCRRYGSDAFETRLMLRKVVCAMGAEAAAVFYHPGRFTRRGAMPPTTVALLQDFGSVQRLDGPAHAHRKALFLRLLDAPGTARMVSLFREEWRRQALHWQHASRVTLLPQAELILCRTACRWAGVPLPDDQAPRRARDLADTIEGAGASGPRLLRGWLARERCERWARQTIRRLRGAAVDAATPAAALAGYRRPDGGRLSCSDAATELLNLLRPTVAVARWIAFAALALHRQPDIRRRLQAGEPGLLLAVVQEVRRLYPFFPFIGGRVREPFVWRGRRFEPGDWMVLDLYGTDHDPRRWTHPERFDPARFADWDGNAYDFIPQGGGEVALTHRCPGENPAIALLMVAVGELANALRYTVPPQDLRYRLDRLPSRPASGFVMADVRAAGVATWPHRPAIGVTRPAPRCAASPRAPR